MLENAPPDADASSCSSEQSEIAENVPKTGPENTEAPVAAIATTPAVSKSGPDPEESLSDISVDTAERAEKSAGAPTGRFRRPVHKQQPLRGVEASTEKYERELWDLRLPLPRADAFSFGTVIDGCSRVGDSDTAVSLLRRMRAEEIASVTHRRTAREAHRGDGDGSAGNGNGNDAKKNTLDVSGAAAKTAIVDDPLPPLNAHCVTAAIAACGRARKPEQALGLLREAVAVEKAWRERDRGERDRARQERGIGVASGARLSENGDEKEELVEGREGGKGAGGRGGVVSLVPAFNAALDACVRAGRHDDARGLVASMREEGLRPGREAFNGLLIACSDSAEVGQRARPPLLSPLIYLFMYFILFFLIYLFVYLFLLIYFRLFSF